MILPIYSLLKPRFSMPPIMLSLSAGVWNHDGHREKPLIGTALVRENLPARHHMISLSGQWL